MPSKYNVDSTGPISLRIYLTLFPYIVTNSMEYINMEYINIVQIPW